MMKIQYLTNIVHTKYNTFTEAMKIQIIYYKGTKTFFVVKKNPNPNKLKLTQVTFLYLGCTFFLSTPEAG